jgi:hypothetical protein
MTTILFDEIDTTFGNRRTAEQNEDVRGLINAGHRRGAKTYRCVARGRDVAVVEYEAFGAVAMAGLGNVPDTILTRSISIRMRRRAPHERVSPYRRRVHAREGHALRDKIAAFARTIEADMADARPDMPDGVEDRDADCWEPLLAIADAAGGEWPERARAAAVAIVAEARQSTPSLGIRLLSDVRAIFADREALSTEIILAGLIAMPEAPWGNLKGEPLSARGLASMLGNYGVKSKAIRMDDKTPRGYTRADLFDVWQRYLPSSEESATSATG